MCINIQNSNINRNILLIDYIVRDNIRDGGGGENTPTLIEGGEKRLS